MSCFFDMPPSATFDIEGMLKNEVKATENEK